MIYVAKEPVATTLTVPEWWDNDLYSFIPTSFFPPMGTRTETPNPDGPDDPSNNKVWPGLPDGSGGGGGGDGGGPGPGGSGGWQHLPDIGPYSGEDIHYHLRIIAPGEMVATAFEAGLGSLAEEIRIELIIGYKDDETGDMIAIPPELVVKDYEEDTTLILPVQIRCILEQGDQGGEMNVSETLDYRNVRIQHPGLIDENSSYGSLWQYSGPGTHGGLDFGSESHLNYQLVRLPGTNAFVATYIEGDASSGAGVDIFVDTFLKDKGSKLHFQGLLTAIFRDEYEPITLAPHTPHSPGYWVDANTKTEVVEPEGE